MHVDMLLCFHFRQSSLVHTERMLTCAHVFTTAVCPRSDICTAFHIGLFAIWTSCHFDGVISCDTQSNVRPIPLAIMLGGLFRLERRGTGCL